VPLQVGREAPGDGGGLRDTVHLKWTI